VAFAGWLVVSFFVVFRVVTTDDDLARFGAFPLNTKPVSEIGIAARQRLDAVSCASVTESVQYRADRFL